MSEKGWVNHSRSMSAIKHMNASMVCGVRRWGCTGALSASAMVVCRVVDFY